MATTVFPFFDAALGAAHQVNQGDYRWYTDATPDGSMVALAAENTPPVLSGAQMQNSVLRLRMQLVESQGTGGSGAVVVQYREAGTNGTWNTLAAQAPATNQEGWWLRYADGAAADAGTIGTTFLTGTTVAGPYIEATGETVTIAANATVEIDVAIRIHWPPPDTTIEFRVTYGGLHLTGIPPLLVTSLAANRPGTVTRLDGDDSQKTSREVRFASWRRIFWDPIGSRWWLFTVQYNTPLILRSYHWAGTGGWTAGATFTNAANMYQTRHALDARVTGTGLTVVAHLGSSSSSRPVVRGTIAGTTLTWGSATAVTQATDRHTHTCIDDAGRFFIGGTTATTGIWVRRATNLDDPTTWDAVDTAADTALVSGDVFTLLGIGTDKAMALWRPAGATQPIKFSVIDAGVASATANATATATTGPEDWGVVRNGNFVYLIHSDASGTGGNWVMRVYDITLNTWVTSTFSPGVSGQPSSNDGIALSVDASGNVYAFGTFAGSEGGQDRKVGYKKYTGGVAGTWDGALTYLDAGGRVNSDHVSTSAGVGNGQILVLSAASDDDAVLNARTLEYFPVNVSSGAFTGTASTTAKRGDRQWRQRTAMRARPPPQPTRQPPRGRSAHRRPRRQPRPQPPRPLARLGL